MGVEEARRTAHLPAAGQSQTVTLRGRGSRVWRRGIAVRVNKWKSTVSLVLLEGDSGDDESTARVIEEFPVTGDDTEWAAHVGNVAR